MKYSLPSGTVSKIWKKDASVWKEDAGVQAEIRSRLGWLEAPLAAQKFLTEVALFAGEIKAAGFKHVALLGMGGSSLCPEVFQKTFGNKKGYPNLWVLDSTDPDRVREEGIEHCGVLASADQHREGPRRLRSLRLGVPSLRRPDQ